MSCFKRTKVVYAGDGTSDEKEILVDAILNLDLVCSILPGRKPGYLVVTMDNTIKYVLKDDVEAILDREKKGQKS